MRTPSFEGKVTRSHCDRVYRTRNTVAPILQNRAVTEHRESKLLPREAAHSKGLEPEILEFTPVCNVILPAVSLLFLKCCVASKKIRTPNRHIPKDWTWSCLEVETWSSSCTSTVSVLCDLDSVILCIRAWASSRSQRDYLHIMTKWTGVANLKMS